MNQFKRMVNRLNFFEKMLLIVGVMVTILGFFFINRIYTGDGHLSWALLQAAFLWLVLLFLIILTDSNESVKEELKEIIHQHMNETKLLKEISKQQLAELREMKDILGNTHNSRKKK